MRLSAYGDSQVNEDGEWNEFRPWEPGVEGKGILYLDEDGREELITWSVDAIGIPDDDGYHHEDMMRYLGLDEGRGQLEAAFSIWPSGEIDGAGGNFFHGQDKSRRIVALEPRLKPPANAWRFATVDENDVLNWDAGQEGKGLIVAPGFVHTWDGEEYETHWDYIDHLDETNNVDVEEYFWISPDGEITQAGIMPLNPRWSELIKEADPRLWDSQSGTGWNFGI